MIDYWNHNTAYHAESLAAVPSSGGDVLDIGYGDRLPQRHAESTLLM